MTAVFAALYILLNAFRASLARVGAQRAHRLETIPTEEPVTLLQPILSGDPLLEETLEVNVAALSSDRIRFLWLIDEADHVARSVATTLQSRYPHARLRVLLCPPVPASTNPKLFKLALAEPEIDAPYFVVLDDDTRLPSATLEALIAALAQADVATGLPVYRRSQGTWSRLVEQFVNNESLLTYLAWPVIHSPITLNGMIYAMRTSRWQARGGFSPLLQHLTDDVAVARLVLSDGGKLHQSSHYVEVSTSVDSFSKYRSLMHRWFLFASLLIADQPLKTQSLLGIAFGLPSLLLWSMGIAALIEFSWIAGISVVITLCFRNLLLTTLQRRFTRIRRHQPLFSLTAELLQPLHVIHALLNRTILWRGRRIRVRDEAHFEYL